MDTASESFLPLPGRIYRALLRFSESTVAASGGPIRPHIQEETFPACFVGEGFGHRKTQPLRQRSEFRGDGKAAIAPGPQAAGQRPDVLDPPLPQCQRDARARELTRRITIGELQ